MVMCVCVWGEQSGGTEWAHAYTLAECTAKGCVRRCVSVWFV